MAPAGQETLLFESAAIDRSAFAKRGIFLFDLCVFGV